MVTELKAERFVATILAASLAALVTATSVSAGAPPRTEQELIERVRTAITARDLDAISELINWDGAATMKRRIVNFQVRYSLGRPIRSVVLEPFPEGGLREIEAQGTLKANMPVTHRLRIVFDDAGDDSVQPASVFLIGKTDDGFRIALIVQAKPRDSD